MADMEEQADDQLAMTCDWRDTVRGRIEEYP